MFQLVYSSMARVPFSKADIENILSVSREKNLQHGVTGVLLYKSGSVIQVLEGDEAAVRQLYANIKKDPRHVHVTIIYTRNITAREFPEWTMGFNCAELELEPTVNGFNPIFHKPDLLIDATGRGAAILKTFVATTR